MNEDREYLRQKYSQFLPCEFAERIIRLVDENEHYEVENSKLKAFCRKVEKLLME